MTAQTGYRGDQDTPGLGYSALPAGLYAPVFALGAVAMETVVAIYGGSYISWGVVLIAAAFWTAAAAVGGLVFGALMMPILMLIKGRARAAVMPDLLVALCAWVTASNMADDCSRVQPLWLGGLLSWAFLPAWAVVLGSVTAWLVATERRGGGRYWICFALAATLFSGGMSFFAGRLGGLVLVAGPFVLLVAGAYAMRRTRLGERRGLFVLCSAGVLAIVLVAAGKGLGNVPPGPIDRGYEPDAGKVAKLAGKPNVVIIVIDTLRADHTTLCGYRYPTTPNLEAFAKDCQFFPNGETVDSWTLPAHASLFTGLYPREHGAHATARGEAAGVRGGHQIATGLARSKPTLATYLSNAGYATGAIAANYTWLYRAYGLDQGFSYYYDLPRLLVVTGSGKRVFTWPLEVVDTALGRNGKLLHSAWDAESVTKMGDSWVGANAEHPFFLFLNYMDAHFPYSAPPPYDKVDGPGIPYNRILRMAPWREFITQYITSGKGLTRRLKKQAVNQYDGGIAYADHWIGEFINRLKARGLYDNTLVVVTSDHGEFFGEHARIDHAMGVYEEGVRIPILAKYPNDRLAGDVRRERTSIIDVFATVFDTLGLAMPKVTARPLGAGGHVVLAEEFELTQNVALYGSRFKGDTTAIYDGDWKYINCTAAPGGLYNLKEDPAESINMAGGVPGLAAQLRARVQAWQSATPLFDGSREAGTALSQEEAKRLNALGYLAR